jgi:dihydrofolate reductase
VTKSFKAIVAMSLNRVIGRKNKLPWHIPEDLKWFKKLTTGNVIIMGRKTWDSIGKPLPNRETIILTSSNLQIPNVRTIRSLSELDPTSDSRDYFVVGGAEVFKMALPLCSDVYLTLVKREVEGDVFLPPFEDGFTPAETVRENSEFAIMHYVAKNNASS